EDGIRDFHVTGVQTCALPIWNEYGIAIYADGASVADMIEARRRGVADGFTTNPTLMAKAGVPDYRAFAKEVLAAIPDLPISFERSEERRVGKECGPRRSRGQR